MKYVPRKKYNVIGKSIPRVDAPQKVTGETRFTGDLKFPNMLYGKILRSPHPHARILKIDKSKAEKLPGVHAVVCGDDFPLVYYGPWLRDQTLFARGRVRYIGEEIAAVAAETPEIAEEALELIKVDYEELPAVFDPIEAMKDDAPKIHEKADEYESIYPMKIKGNINSHVSFYHGDVEKSFEESDLVIEETFTTPIQYQAYLEPQGSIAMWDSSGKLTVYVPTQSVFFRSAFLARMFQMPISKVRVISPEVGGGFGGKMHALTEPAAAALAMVTKKPVKVVLSRAEDMQAGNPRHAQIVTLKVGFNKDGTLHGFKARIITDAGAFTHEGPAMNDLSAIFVRGPYVCPNVRIDAYCVYTNKIVCGAFRGFGNPQVTFAREQMLDIAVEKLGISRVDIRSKNFSKAGDALVSGQIITSVGVAECLEEVRKAHKLDEPIKGKNRGRGFAAVEQPTGLLASSAFVKINEDGSVTAMNGCSNIGGGQSTVLAQIVAEALTIDVDKVTVALADTEATPYEWGDFASRITFCAGNALLVAVEDIKKQLFEIVAEKFEISIDDLELKNGRVMVKALPEKSMSIAEISFARHWYPGDGPIIGRGSYYPPEPERNPDIMSGAATALWPATMYCVQAVDLEVDPETGFVTLLKWTVADDVGQAINPMGVEGQLEGGIVQGMGYGLYEAIQFDNGKVVNPSFLDYKIPTAMNVPEIETIIVEEPLPQGPFGAKGCGEPTLVGAAPAIANAIYDAVGVRMKHLPITPEKLFFALKESKK